MEKFFKPFDIVLISILAGLCAVLDIVGVIGIPMGILSVSSFYIGAGFYLLFLYLYGWKGALGIYLGLNLASVFTTGFSVMPLLLAWGNVLAPLFIIFIMKKLQFNCELKSARDYFLYIPLAVIAPLISGGWVLGGFVIFKIIPAAAFPVALTGWAIGGAVVNLVVGTLLMRFVAPIAKKMNLA